jgi:hypothetical protein
MALLLFLFPWFRNTLRETFTSILVNTVDTHPFAVYQEWLMHIRGKHHQQFAAFYIEKEISAQLTRMICLCVGSTRKIHLRQKKISDQHVMIQLIYICSKYHFHVDFRHYGSSFHFLMENLNMRICPKRNFCIPARRYCADMA